MTADIDVVDRLEELRTKEPSLKLYALVDGAQYKTLRDEPLDCSGLYSLFSGTPDAALAHAGPWLVDVEQAGQSVVADLFKFERQAPAVSWLMALQDLTGLAQLLQLNLDAELPDGRKALMRFWDARVLSSLAEVLEPHQRAQFFAHIYEWHMLNNQKRVWLGRVHA
jgi:hypothetical protein